MTASRRVRLSALWAVAAFATSIANGAPSIYKCKDANGGTVFLPTPCGKGVQEVQLHSGNREAATGQASKDANESPAADKQPAPVKVDAIRDISDGVADSHCRDDARKLYIEPDTSSLAHAQAELQALQGRSWVGGSASSRQILDETDQTHMASLRGLIATEQARADATRADSQKRVDGALSQCNDRKRELEESRKRGN